MSSTIPVLIICFNNYKYVKHMIQQLKKLDDIKVIIINNCSTCPYTINYLKLGATEGFNVINVSNNSGNNAYRIASIYDSLPEQFALTDPDLLFPEDFPSNVLQQFKQIADKYQSHKVGCALDISDPEKMYPYKSHFNMHIAEAQSLYWKLKINDEHYEMYAADVDTTFCLISKKYKGYNVRIARSDESNFIIKHIPWYPHFSGFSWYNNYLTYKDADPKISSVRVYIDTYMKENRIILVPKNGEKIVTQLGTINDEFWTHHYVRWEPDTFETFDKFLDSNKEFLDIGGWIGPTCIYASRKSSRVVVVEADPESLIDLRKNIELNHFDTEIVVVPYAIYSSETTILFGPNNESPTKRLNESVSQIKSVRTSPLDSEVKTITLNQIIERYNVKNLSMIKVDIEGGEEFILEDLFNFCMTNKVPCHISFHYDWWVNKDLERFKFLPELGKQTIKDHPFVSMMFKFG